MFIDVHCHANLYMTLEETIKEAHSVGVDKIIAVGMSQLSQQRILEISSYFDSIYPALGIHPEEVENNEKIMDQIDEVLDLIKKNGEKLCAIGEIGLDHHFVKNKDLYPSQEKIFHEMLSIAQELSLPVNLHTKGAEQQVFDILPSYNLPGVNIHWYSGPENLLKLGIDRGYYYSITPAISYSPAVKKTTTIVNVDHILLESDGPVEYRGRTGTPAMIKDVIKTVSKIKNVDEKELESQIEMNTRKIFPKIF